MSLCLKSFTVSINSLKTRFEGQMEPQLINHEYIQELLSVAQDQNEDNLVMHLFGRLMEAREAFLQGLFAKSSLETEASVSGEMKLDRKQLRFDLHKLKNQFANLGCVAASQLLEQMYQIAEVPEKDPEFKTLFELFQKVSDSTLVELKIELHH